LDAIAGLGDHVDVRYLIQQCAQAGADEAVVIGE
jgi:hypothetical protein